MKQGSESSLQPKPLRVPARFIASGALQFGFIYWFTHRGALGGANMVEDALNEFLFVFLPTVSIVILIPVLVRGSSSQKILASILLLFPAWFAITGWWAIIVDHVLN